MPLISQTLPNLTNGVSQQAAALRLPSQCEAQENCYSSIVDGLIKRPPTVHQASLGFGTPVTDAYIHLANFGGDIYVVMVFDDDIKVFDTTGTEKTVDKPDGVLYLNAVTPKTDFAVITVADYTFIVNKTIETAMSATVSADEDPAGFIWVKSGVADTDYSATVGGNLVTYTSGGTGAPNTWKTTYIASQLATLITALPNYTAVAKGSLVKIQRTDLADFTFSVEDSWGNKAQQGIKGSVQSFADLPDQFWPDFTLEVTGISGESNVFDNMYVHWIEGTSTGTWKETVQPGLQDAFNAATMPHVLVREPAGTFTFRQETWGTRKVGDTDLAPEPSFIGRKINDVFFYKDRLGFLADENLIVSRAGEYFEFWPETVSDILDSDPIDVSASNNKVSLLRHAVPFDESLLVFSAKSQFVLNHEDVLSPTSVSIDITTEFESNLDAKPVGVGKNLYFMVGRGNYSGVREYFVDSEVVTNDAADITAHVPKYIPANVHKLAAASNDDLLLVLSSDQPNILYAYKHHWDGEKKIQSSWSKWILDTDANILGIDVVDTVIYLVVQRTDDVYLEKLDIQAEQIDVGLPLLVHLDRKTTITGSYDSGTDKTTFTLPYPNLGVTQVVLGAAFTGAVGNILNTTKVSDTVLEANGDWSAGIVYVGVPYTKKYQFSEQFVKDSQNNAVLTAKVIAKRLYVSFVNTGYFRMEVQPLSRKLYTYEFTGKVLGTTTTIIGEPSIVTGSFKVPLGAQASDVTVTIINDTYLPSTFQSAEFELQYTNRNKIR